NPRITDSRTLYQFYDRVAPTDNDSFETQEAMKAGLDILNELYARRRHGTLRLLRYSGFGRAGALRHVRAARPARLSFTGAGTPPPARTDADASPRISMSSARHGGRGSLPRLGPWV